MRLVAPWEYSAVLESPVEGSVSIAFFNTKKLFSNIWLIDIYATGIEVKLNIVHARLIATVKYLLDKMALGQVFSDYFGFPYRFSLQQLLHIH
jgi:hypothetical protein